MDIRSFEEMYKAELQEARSLEEMLTKALPKMAEAAADQDLKRAFDRHLSETRSHLDGVNDLLKRHNAKAEHRDSSMQAMTHEAEKMIGMMDKGPLRDAAMIASAQRVEHYEIAVYGTLATYAKSLGLMEDKKILGSILEEEKAADEALTDIATAVVNPHALAQAA